MVAIDSITERRTVTPTDNAMRRQSARRSGDRFSLCELPSHRTSRRFVTRLFWG